jgi:hydrogenase maturation protease
MSERIPLLVLGLGNVLCSDDGAGVVALHQLRRGWRLPAGVVAEDGGTLGLALLPLVEHAERVLILDAVRGDGAPGTAIRLEGDEVAKAAYERLSPHQIGVADLLAGAALTDRTPSVAILIGVVPASIELGLGLTPEVAAAIPYMVVRAIEELTTLGFAPTPSVDDAPREVAALALGL